MVDISKLSADYQKQKLEVAAMHMESNEDLTKILLGDTSNLSEPPKISYFDPVVVRFLSELSELLLNNNDTKKYGDIVAFGYWIRKSNLDKSVNNYRTEANRVGYGMCMHFAPSNVPMNFAYSLVAGLISGNRNIVRVPTRTYPQITLLIESLKIVLSNPIYRAISHAICIISYPREESISRKFLEFCNVKIVWGGDSSVRQIRSIPTPAHCREIVFPDRKSIAVINQNSLDSLGDEDIRKLAGRFYTDTYLFDQNACSSPRIIFWLRNGANSPNGRSRFWDALSSIVDSRYNLEPGNLVLKFTELAEISALSDIPYGMSNPGNLLTVFEYKSSPESLSSRLTNRFGSFFNYDIKELNDLAPMIDSRIQTLAYFGVESSDIVSLVTSNHLKGVDRIVPIGSALNFDFVWDGYDLPRSLSRIITHN